MSIILVLEDDPCLQQEIGDLLKKEGNTVKTASSYQEALQMVLNRELIDLYLVDVMLPDGDGFSLCEKIRERNTCPILDKCINLLPFIVCCAMDNIKLSIIN